MGKRSPNPAQSGYRVEGGVQTAYRRHFEDRRSWHWVSFIVDLALEQTAQVLKGQEASEGVPFRTHLASPLDNCQDTREQGNFLLDILCSTELIPGRFSGSCIGPCCL